MDDRPRVSIVVATRDRRALLERLLDACAAQSLERSRFEIVVVDDASSDGTAELLASRRERGGAPLTVLRHDSSRGPAAARNRGWRASRGEIVAFTDDDCRPEPGWLEAGLAAIETGRDVVMGRTRADETAPGYGEPFSRAMEVDHEDGRYPTCNVFYRRSVLEAVGGFDESFLYACGEDTDLAWRAREAGYTTGFAADAVIEHVVRPPDFWLFLRERRRFAEQVQVVGRHPGLRSVYYRRWFYRRSHVHAIASLLLGAGALAVPALGLALPLVWLHRLRGTDLGRAAPRAVTAAQILIGDHWELLVFAAASVRYRALLL